MYAALDPNGFRPLSIGRIGDSYVVASETCAFETVGAEFVRDVEPGELIIINDDGLRIEKFTEHSICSMEYIYFARPDSNIAGVCRILVFLRRLVMPKKLGAWSHQK
ncbi:Amidophosphoribosyltransferase [Listeria monocytogenes N53-1]|nr:Amidophosphoribosyltransferase [Listeria monocytogenes N53-1]